MAKDLKRENRLAEALRENLRKRKAGKRDEAALTEAQEAAGKG